MPFRSSFLFLSMIFCLNINGLAINSIVPKPSRIVSKEGSFTLQADTRLMIKGVNREKTFAIEYFVKQISQSAGYSLQLSEQKKGSTQKNVIVFERIEDGALGKEGYRLDVSTERVQLSAASDVGIFYGVQTLLQLLPPMVYSPMPSIGVLWTIPCISIEDVPRFIWRGMHLDVSRHFFPKEFIYTYIDMLAMHKINVFHWHLTDDQGWRIEIKGYPKLTQIGAWRVDREQQAWDYRPPQQDGEAATYGGYYTQDEIRGIVEYATQRHITIVPEVEMPAHATAALAAYPDYSCTGGPFKVLPGGVWPITDIYCAGNDSTFVFLQNVLAEVIDLFPGTYIHIGGDEADKKEWKVCPKCQNRIRQEGLMNEQELQSYFVKRIEKFLISKNRRLIGWDEILEGGLAPEATVMSWRGTEGGIAAAREGHDVIMTPTSFCYFDYYQGRPDAEPLAIGGYVPLSRVYTFEPVPDSLSSSQQHFILGGQGNVWTEFIPTPQHIQYMTLPRMAAMAEVLWSPKELRDWSDFSKRIEPMLDRYRILGYNYSKSAYAVSCTAIPDPTDRSIAVSLSTEAIGTEIRYTLDESSPSPTSALYQNPFRISSTTRILAASFTEHGRIGMPLDQEIFCHKALMKPVIVKYPFERYTAGGPTGLTNGVRGSLSYMDGNWQGYRPYDFEGIIDLKEVHTISRISSSYLQDTRSWIFFPKAVEYAISTDGLDYTPLSTEDIPATTTPGEPSIKSIDRKFTPAKARYVRVRAKNFGVCPEWHIAKGESTWLFIDEIVVE